MVKKVILVAAGAGLVFALLFGRAGLSYVQTTVSEIRDGVHDNVPIDFQIKNARNELKKLDPEIHGLMRNIAREELELDDLREEVSEQRTSLDESFAHIMRLKAHLEEGDSYFVVKGESYSSEEVERDLRVRFDDHKTRAETLNNLSQVLEAREVALDAAREELAQTQAARHNLELRIEKLEAEARMLEVAKSSSNLNFDDSRISRTEQLVDDIESRIAVDKKVTNTSNSGEYRIPLEREEESDDIAEEIEVYFSGGSRDYVKVED